MIDLTDFDFSKNKKKHIVFSGLRSDVVEKVNDRNTYSGTLMGTLILGWGGGSSAKLLIHLT